MCLRLTRPTMSWPTRNNTTGYTIVQRYTCVYTVKGSLTKLVLFNLPSICIDRIQNSGGDSKDLVLRSPSLCLLQPSRSRSLVECWKRNWMSDQTALNYTQTHTDTSFVKTINVVLLYEHKVYYTYAVYWIPWLISSQVGRCLPLCPWFVHWTPCKTVLCSLPSKSELNNHTLHVHLSHTRV